MQFSTATHPADEPQENNPLEPLSKGTVSNEAVLDMVPAARQQHGFRLYEAC